MEAQTDVKNKTGLQQKEEQRAHWKSQIDEAKTEFAKAKSVGNQQKMNEAEKKMKDAQHFLSGM